MIKRPTPFLVNAALHDAGLPYEIVRNRLGGAYYWFYPLDGTGSTNIPSIWQYNLSGWTFDSIVDHVREHHQRWQEERVLYGLAISRPAYNGEADDRF